MNSIGTFLVVILIVMACVTQCNRVENKTETECSTMIVPVGKTTVPITNCKS